MSAVARLHFFNRMQCNSSTLNFLATSRQPGNTGTCNAATQLKAQTGQTDFCRTFDVLRILSWLQPLGSGASTASAAVSCLKNSICLRDLSRCTTRKPCSWQGTNQGGNGSSAIVTASAMHAPLCVQVKQLIWVSRGPRRDSGTKSGSRQPSRGHSRRAGGEGGNATRL